VYFLMHAQIHSPTFVDECCHLHVEVGNFSDSPHARYYYFIAVAFFLKSHYFLIIKLFFVFISNFNY